MNRSKLLAVLAILVGNIIFVMAVIYYSFQPRWIASYIAVILLYATLYFHRSPDLPEGLRRRLAKAAVTLGLGLFLTAIFFYNFASGLQWWLAGVVWLGLAAAAHFLYDVIFEMEDDALVQLQGSRPPV